MTSRAATLLVTVVVGSAMLCVGGLIGLAGGAAACAPFVAPSAVTSGAAPDLAAGYDSDQLTNASIIVSVGAGRGVPVRGLIVAVATAIQESSLRNLGDLGEANDHDSLGLFQQRPSQGWGTPSQLQNPGYAAATFYRHLRTVTGWQTLPLTDAAQAVQRSAYPDAYAKWEDNATRLVHHLTPGTTPALPVQLGQCGGCPDAARTTTATDPSVGASGQPVPCRWVTPVDAPIVSGFRTPSRPGHDGVDLGATRGTPIRAASAGTVTVVRCNISPADYGCDRDGSPATPGCGWYIQIRHHNNILTRYCHLLHQPTVAVGQPITVGQVIGYVGSSGHSSGPHLHFEVHLNNDPTPAGAIDPIPFMASRAPLGQASAAQQ